MRSRVAWLAVFVGCWSIAFPLLFFGAALGQQDVPQGSGYGILIFVLAWALFVAPFILRMLKK